MLNPKLSIIVPVYNVEKYIAKCLDSLVNQTLQDIEIICVDDCSSDKSVSIIKKYMKKDKRIRLICHTQNKGLAATRNTGLKSATAELIAFADSDDYLELNAYEKAVNTMASEIDIVCFGIGTGGDISPERKKMDDEYYAIKYSGSVKITDDILLHTDVSSCNKIFRKSIIDKYAISFPDGLRYEDAYFFNVYGIRCQTAFFMKDKLYHYVRRENSIMSSTFTGEIGVSIDHVKIAIKLYEYLKHNNLFAEHKNHFYRLFFAYVNFSLYHEKTFKGHEQIYDLAINFLDKEKISLNNSPEFFRDYRMLKNRILFLTTQRYMKFIKIKRTASKKVYYVFGIPVLRIKYKKYHTKYYLFSILRILTKRIEISPRISVIMPAYNAEKYIAQAIESILNQTFKDFEFIIINDGSTDNTVKIINQYQDERIILINNEKNKGLVPSLNQGLKLASGEYIARMDADDISLPDRFMKQIKYMDKHPKIGVLGSWFHIFGEEINRIETKLKSPKLADMIETSPVGHPTAMLRKKFFDKYYLQYDPAYTHAEDYELWTRVIKFMKIANLPEVLLNYRWAKGNVSHIHEKEQSLKSDVIKQKIRRATKKQMYCMNMNPDDTQLLSVFKKMGAFSYMPNSGNMGDMLIAGATMQWFDKNGLDWHRTYEGELPENFVYGGGGAWLHEWIEYMKPTMDIMTKAKKVVILPSSFNNVPEFIKILDERFIVFCREKKSYDYLKSQNTKAKILLDHDMAFRLNGKFKKNFEAPNKILKKKLKKLEERLSQLNKNVDLFRNDSESAGHYRTDLDLSDALGWFSQYESREHIDFAMKTMIKAVYNFDTIKTDRLHVAIAAALTGADVILYDNSYGKISGVYQQTLYKLPNVQMNKEREKE